MTNDSPTNEQSLHAMAEEIFALNILAWRERIANRSNTTELSESQFLTLDILAKGGTLTVGELQRGIGVLPAQMSRIIRSLEDAFDKPLIRCELNQSDKRKIDVTLTPAGRDLHDEFRNTRLAKTLDILVHLPDQDRQEFVRICRKIKELYNTDSAAKTRQEEAGPPAKIEK
jgi:DNA-binding MarR family transcriptional regulator